MNQESSIVVLFILNYAFMGLGLYDVVSRIIERKKCNKKVSAKCINTKYRSSAGYNTYDINVIFSLDYNNKAYPHIIAVDRLTRKELSQFVEGENYEVLINKDNPKLLRCTKRIIRIDEIISGIIYSYMLILPTIYLIIMLLAHLK